MRLVRLIVICLLCAGTLIGAARALGYQQPAPKRVTLLELDRCKLPCWMGIEVGKTTVEDATAALLSLNDSATAYWHVDKRAAPQSTFTGLPRRIQFYFRPVKTPRLPSSFSVYMLYNRQQIVDGLVLDFFNKELEFGALELSDLIVNMSAPTSITTRTTRRTQYDTELNLIFESSFMRPYFQSKQFAQSDRMLPDYRISSIQIWPRYSEYGQKLEQSLDLRSRWLGFTTHYRQFQDYRLCCQTKAQK